MRLRCREFHRQKKKISEDKVSAVLCLQQSITRSMLISLRKNYDSVLEVFKTVSTHCSEIGPRCNEVAWVSKIVMLRKLAVASMELAAMRRYGC